MDDPALESIERQLAASPLAGAPADLRGAVLTGVRSQLSAQRWDRRLGRAAAAVLVVGVGLNALIGWHGDRPAANQTAAADKSDAITRAAVFVAEATDAETGTQIARHLAALGGTTLSQDQEAVIQNEIKSHIRSAAGRRKDG